ncbi:DUF1045 domain-containing protein [uncultured Roseibium sp.]|uniref:DUF1045 domain-containing protein n=1 Tax=uncultured Roseibium sp. TaxID=1936171 RepID=UPI00260C4D81|nr:DUF1045 domain-containing protein [uncultured Roseibium sp.]
MRYAIYFAATADDSLMLLGNAWLGRDTFTGNPLPQPGIEGLSQARVAELTSSPRRYGFHGTLKAPFFLREGETENTLVSACEDFASSIAPFEIQKLGVNRLGKFLALTPDQDEPDLKAFAGLCVRHFDKFRAPLSDADLERRRKSGLSPKQDAYLQDWGYPYIFDEFRFHMTLSNKLDAEKEAEFLTESACAFFAKVTGNRRRCSHFGLYVEPEPGAPFQVQKIFELTGGTAPCNVQFPDDSLTRKENV